MRNLRIRQTEMSTTAWPTVPWRRTSGSRSMESGIISAAGEPLSAMRFFGIRQTGIFITAWLTVPWQPMYGSRKAGSDIISVAGELLSTMKNSRIRQMEIFITEPPTVLCSPVSGSRSAVNGTALTVREGLTAISGLIRPKSLPVRNLPLVSIMREATEPC